MKKIIPGLLYLCLLLSCAKEIISDYPTNLIPGPDTAVPDPANTAKYEFIGVNGACSDASVEGTFTAGNAVNESNYLRVTVYVTTTGTWSMKIPAVNGISFSGNGTFEAAGLQPVILPASGTPVKAQSMLAGMTSTSGSCAVSYTIQN
jgi:hypothetical protein